MVRAEAGDVEELKTQSCREPGCAVIEIQMLEQALVATTAVAGADVAIADVTVVADGAVLAAGALAIGLCQDAEVVDSILPARLPESVRDTVQTYLAETEKPAALAKAGTVTQLPCPGNKPRLVLLVGLGDGSVTAARLAGAALVRQESASMLSAILPADQSAEALAAFAEGVQLASYHFGTAPNKKPRLKKLTITVLDDGAQKLDDGAQKEAGPSKSAKSKAAPSKAIQNKATSNKAARSNALSQRQSELLDRGQAYACGALWARELINTRTNTKTPAWLGAAAVRELTPLGVAVTVRDEQWLAEQGFGGVLGVGAGSSAPPRLIEASWRPAASAIRAATALRSVDTPHVVLVGKGITFDTGGYNLKPGASMTTMYTDMAGGAAVLAALRIVAQLLLPIRVTAVVPVAENSVSGKAMRPGDVLRHYGGRTSEITNTDAEGRLVLADALAYAAVRLRPSCLVDVATLTGAMKMALGERMAGLISTDDVLATQLQTAADQVDEPLWRMPLIADYGSQLHSSVADANNSPGNPGGITAALFLQPFVGDVPWAHLDIAGPARAARATGITTAGATGFGARLLAQWIENHLIENTTS